MKDIHEMKDIHLLDESSESNSTINLHVFWWESCHDFVFFYKHFYESGAKIWNSSSKKQKYSSENKEIRGILKMFFEIRLLKKQFFLWNNRSH